MRAGERPKTRRPSAARLSGESGGGGAGAEGWDGDAGGWDGTERVGSRRRRSGVEGPNSRTMAV